MPNHFHVHAGTGSYHTVIFLSVFSVVFPFPGDYCNICFFFAFFLRGEAGGIPKEGEGGTRKFCVTRRSMLLEGVRRRKGWFGE